MSRIDRMRLEDVDTVLAIEAGASESARWDAESIRAELEKTWAYLWVARVETHEREEVVAFVATWLVVDELHVLNVATDRAHRRRGHARALMTTALTFAREKHVRLVLLEVRRSNAGAIALYRSLGFVAMGIRARYYADDEDAVEMLLRLDPATGEIVAGEDEITLL